MVPRVLQVSSIEDKHVVLVEGIFNYFAVAYGTKEKKRSCKKRQRKIARKLRKAKEMKNDARRELAIAKKANSFSSEQIMSLARKLYQSVRVHNKVKKISDQSQERVGAKAARRQCHENFWQFSKKLLENRTVADVQTFVF